MTTLLEITEGIALDFLHSVVLIDDRVYLPPLPPDALTAIPVPAEIVVPTRRGARPSEEQEEAAAVAAEVVEIPVTEHPLDAKPLLDRFADQGLVCAVLRLDRDEDAKRTVKAAQRADIVVLDWKINAVYGDTTLQIIRDILTTGDAHRLRLIAIYTGENNLVEITNRVRTELDAIVGTTYQYKKDEGFAVSRGPIRVVVYAKAETKLPEEDAELHARIAPASVLPDRLLKEFAAMTSGLVSNVALEALARLRANTHRILQRLHPGLDPAYLGHRALVTPPDEAEDHLVALVAAEIAGILDEGGVGRGADISAIRAWLRDRLAAGADFRRVFELGADDQTDPVDALCTLLELGVAHDGVPEKLKALKGRKAARTLTERFCTPATDSARRDSEFAMLLALRERYVTRPPILTLGTILATTVAGVTKYWVCVQPACDCLRLKSKRQFPMLPLAIVGENHGFDVIVIEGAEVVRLKASLKPYDQKLVEFEPDPQSHTVKPAVEAGKPMTFTAVDGTQYRWVGELKPDHAQRFLHALGSEHGRVGVVESELMRRSRGDS